MRAFLILQDNQINRLDPAILEHNVNALGLEKRGDDRTYDDLSNLMQIQQGRENVSPACKKMFDLITRQKLDKQNGRKQVEELFSQATIWKYKIAWPDHFEKIIKSDTKLRNIKKQLEQNGRKAVSPWWFIEESIYFTMVAEGIVPLADHHDLFGHLISYADPAVAKQTDTMAQLYGQFINYYGVLPIKHKLYEGLTQFTGWKDRLFIFGNICRKPILRF